jgi:hypothetical protein
MIVTKRHPTVNDVFCGNNSAKVKSFRLKKSVSIDLVALIV